LIQLGIYLKNLFKFHIQIFLFQASETRIRSNSEPEKLCSETKILIHKEEEPDQTNKVLNALIKSNNEVIKNCAQSIEGLNEQIKQNEFPHKITLFKRIDRELFKLMIKLDDIDIENNPELEEERRLALLEIHDSIKLLDSKVKCNKKLNDCIVCKTGIEL
jgi:hypothetical protein